MSETTTTTTQGCGCSSSQQASVKPNAISRILNKVFVSEAEKQRRMTLCRGCEHFNDVLVQCKICGCFLEAKTRLQTFHCALDQIGQEPLW